jgi:hypothetical protein
MRLKQQPSAPSTQINRRPIPGEHWHHEAVRGGEVKGEGSVGCGGMLKRMLKP